MKSIQSNGDVSYSGCRDNSSQAGIIPFSNIETLLMLPCNNRSKSIGELSHFKAEKDAREMTQHCGLSSFSKQTDHTC